MSNPYSNPYVSKHRNRTKATATTMAAMEEEVGMVEDRRKEEAMVEAEDKVTITTLTNLHTMDMVINRTRAIGAREITMML